MDKGEISKCLIGSGITSGVALLLIGDRRGGLSRYNHGATPPARQFIGHLCCGAIFLWRTILFLFGGGELVVAPFKGNIGDNGEKDEHYQYDEQQRDIICPFPARA